MFISKNIISIKILIILFLQYYAAVTQGQSYTIKTIVTDETELVDTTGLTIDRVSSDSFSINNNGTIILTAGLSDGTAGIIRFSNEKLKLIFKTAKAQPINESVFFDISFANINDNDEIVFYGILSGGKKGLFKILSNGDIIPLVLDGDSVQGLKSSIEGFNTIRAASQNNNGAISFNATLSDSRRGLFLLKKNMGIIVPIILEGDPFPLDTGEETLVSAGNPSTINDKGEILFRASYFKDISKEKIDSGIFLFRNDLIIPIKVPRQEAPGTNEKLFRPVQFNSPVLSQDSQVIFFGSYHNPETITSYYSGEGSEFGLFLWENNVLKPLVLADDPVPGANAFFNNTNHNGLTHNAINKRGEAVSFLYFSYERGGGGGGIFLFSDDKIIPVTLSFFKDYFFKDHSEFLLPFTCGINDNGDIVFDGRFGLNKSGLFLAKKENTLFQVFTINPRKAANGSLLEVEVSGSGFQPGAMVTFSRKGIRILKSVFKASTTVIGKFKITQNAMPGFYNVIVTNPTGEVAVLENGFRVIKE